MKIINKTDALNEAIVILEKKQALELRELTEQFKITYESLKPVNLIKNTLSEVTKAPDIKNNFINNAIGLATGFLSSRFLLGSSRNPIKRTLGTILQYAVANVVSKHSGGIKSTAGSLLSRIFSKPQPEDEEEEQVYSKNGNYI